MPKSNLLLVEGGDDLHSVVGLMRAHIPWPNTRSGEDKPIFIKHGYGADDLLSPDLIHTELKSPGLKALGIMLDADTDSPNQRYQRLRQLCLSQFPSMPPNLAPSGLIVEGTDGQRLGFWVMPDNISPGSLETFLRYLVPEHAKPLWQHAMDSVTGARVHGATYRDCDVDKANLYTWLAWQNSPAQSPGRALTAKILDPYAGYAAGFVKWLLELCEFSRA
jgi:hypothetical protein